MLFLLGLVVRLCTLEAEVSMAMYVTITSGNMNEKLFTHSCHLQSPLPAIVRILAVANTTSHHVLKLECSIKAVNWLTAFSALLYFPMNMLNGQERRRMRFVFYFIRLCTGTASLAADLPRPNKFAFSNLA